MKDFVALLDALIEQAEKDVEMVTALERRKGSSYFQGKKAGLQMARDKAAALLPRDMRPGAGA